MKASPSVKGDRVYVGDLGRQVLLPRRPPTAKVSGSSRPAARSRPGCNFHGNNVLIGSHDSTLYCLDRGRQEGVGSEDRRPGERLARGRRRHDVRRRVRQHPARPRREDRQGTRHGRPRRAGGGDRGGRRRLRLRRHDGEHRWSRSTGRSRRRLWAFEAAGRQQPFYASAAVTDDSSSPAAATRRCTASTARPGKSKLELHDRGQVDASPVVVGDRVYVGCLSDDGNFYVLDLKTGKKLQELEPRLGRRRVRSRSARTASWSAPTRARSTAWGRSDRHESARREFTMTAAPPSKRRPAWATTSSPTTRRSRSGRTTYLPDARSRRSTARREPASPLGLYLHIPFCRKRCKFCYFRVYTDKNANDIEVYLDALLKEVELLSKTACVGGRPLDYVYFGGGTPSYLSADATRRPHDAARGRSCRGTRPARSRSSANRARFRSTSSRRSATTASRG